MEVRAHDARLLGRRTSQISVTHRSDVGAVRMEVRTARIFDMLCTAMKDPRTVLAVGYSRRRSLRALGVGRSMSHIIC